MSWDWEFVLWTVIVLGGLMGFGVWYDRFVCRLEEQEIEGYRAVMVVGGVAATGVGFAMIMRSMELGVVLLMCFVASGLPMIVGNIRRYLERRAREIEAIRQTAWKELHDDG